MGVVQPLELRAELAVPLAFGAARLHEALGQLALVVQRLLGAPERVLEAFAFRALPLRLLLRLLADGFKFSAGLLARTLLPGVALLGGLAEGVHLRLGGGPPRRAAGEVVARLGERRLGVGAPARRAPPGVETPRRRPTPAAGRRASAARSDRRADGQGDDQHRRGQQESADRDPRLQPFPIASVHGVTW